MSAMPAEEPPIRARLRPKHQLTLPPEVREALLVEPGDEVEFELVAPGVVRLLGTKRIPADQAWFWTQDWQAGEREASAERDRGEATVYTSAEEMFDALGVE
ncbi:AbrB/MazE/SpoVT family DNA-binding domain-containing protein [Streptacidiphilus sp. MAP5-52]|uniref:AbrB/MazE/SpoVT family DNA-binding domain-containing protein n=1 Tax=Streptacidiphilus sp. MAP5-52 TaxID=3156267 RepID=UPI00351783CE